MIKDELLDFLKKNGHELTEEAKASALHLAEILEAQKKKLDDVALALAWLKKKDDEYKVNTSEVPIRELDRWYVHPETGHIHHESGKFFSIIGVKVEGAEGREVLSWTQPMMKQEECGILGILCQKRDGVMHYLFYAKYEPGSIAGLQLAPALQATASNLARAHGGKKPLLSEYFEEGGKGKVLVSVEQVEDPSRFYHKTNRCMIVEVDKNEEVKVPDDFIWLTLPQVKKLLKVDNIINALARCVLGSR